MMCNLPMPERGALLLTGHSTHDGTPNVCRVIRYGGVSDGFYAVYVDPWNTRELRCPTDREFFVWRGSRDHAQMSPYRGIETPAIQPRLMEV